VIRESGFEVLVADPFVIVIFPSSVRDVLVDGFSSPENEDKVFAFFVSGKGISRKRRAKEVFVFSQWVPSSVFFFTLFPLFCHAVRVTV
jgi:hypothetical protein